VRAERSKPAESQQPRGQAATAAPSSAESCSATTLQPCQIPNQIWTTRSHREPGTIERADRRRRSWLHLSVTDDAIATGENVRGIVEFDDDPHPHIIASAQAMCPSKRSDSAVAR
jgi:hypothetical protein